MDLYALKISLDHITPPIWRLVTVPGNYTISDLHFVIQYAMGWENNHLYQFIINGKTHSSSSYEGQCSPRFADYDGDDYTIEEVLGNTCKKFLYTYDFGDSWDHTITVKNITTSDDKTNDYPLCLEGKRACPPEDCGGAPGYYRILDELKKPEEEMDEDLREWLDDYDPEKFDIDTINKFLTRLGKNLHKQRKKVR